MSEIQTTPQVEYRSIPGYPDYRAGDDGSIWSKRKSGEWKRLRGSPNHWGYRCVCLVGVDGRQTKSVHSCVLRSFVGELPEGLEARHLNSNKSDNRLANLKYGTPVENMLDQIITPRGRKLGGIQRLVLKDIMRRFDAGESIPEISRALLVNERNITFELCRKPYYRKKIYQRAV